MKKKALIPISFRVDAEKYKLARKNYDVPEIVRFAIELMATNELEVTSSKMKLKTKVAV
jgi:hypothetical protein